MNSRKLLVVLWILSVSMWAMAGDAAKPAKSDAAQMFERLKALEGEWESDSPGLGKVRAVYKVVGGGSAVEEHFSGEKIPGGEMITLYHLDGDRLVLTHYCAAANQPRMVAKRIDPANGEVDFVFLDATNLSSPNAGHMRNARIQLVDANHFNSQWEFFQDGKLKNTESDKYTRVR
jgi:hypothetical protein